MAKSTRRGGRDGDSSADASALAEARAARGLGTSPRSCSTPRRSPRPASLKRARRRNASPVDASRRRLGRSRRAKVTTRPECSACFARATAACDRGCAARASSIACIAEPLARPSDASAGVVAGGRSADAVGVESPRLEQPARPFAVSRSQSRMNDDRRNETSFSCESA